MRRRAWFLALAFVSLALLFAVVVVHLGFFVLPIFFLALGFVSYLLEGRKALLLFLFLLPLVNSTPDLFANGYPFNYMGIPLFHLAGMFGAALAKKERLDACFPGQGPYLLFLSLLGVSAIFVFLRWSNLDVPSLAMLADTPAAPSLERISFACVFPAITLALFALSPWAAILIRHWRLRGTEALVALKAGFFLSFLLALAQKWINPDLLAQRWWSEKNRQLNGGFSDFNAFGFFAGSMFLWQALKLIERLPVGEKEAGKAKTGSGRRRPPPGAGLKTDLIFLVIALAAIFLSGCRTAFLFVLAALVRLLLAKRPSRRIKTAAVLLLLAALVLAGGTLGKRLWRSTHQLASLHAAEDLFLEIDTISSGRLSMLRDSGRIIGRFPWSGVGAGNFLFFLKYMHFGEEAYFDLPLNQYSLFFNEAGIFGGLAFLFFLASLLRQLQAGKERLILAVMAGSLLFNNFFWFPEALLLFWVVVSRGEWPPGPKRGNGFVWAVALLLLFAVANGIAFDRLHPRTWARATSTPYDYGFSYPEHEGSRSFRWSGAKAGIYLFPGENGRLPEIVLTCGAPLSRLPGRQQAVDVYWRGKLLKQVVFKENTSEPIRIEDKEHPGGFLEFRVHPTFNLSKLDLGPESRDLGVQVEGGA